MSTTVELNPQILRFDSLPSTNLEAAKRATEGASEGLCIVAREQTAGRGRLERPWISPMGAGLYFSIILRPQFEQRGWPLITLMAAVAVAEALLNSCGLATDIKWPNDIMFQEKKLCGVLAETIETKVGRAVVVGIGINLHDSAFPPEIAKVATSVEAATSARVGVEPVLDALVQSLNTYYRMLQTSGGAEDIVAEWCRRSSYCLDKLIRVTDSSETFEGITRGLERDGALRVETKSGEIRIVRVGDVTATRAVSV